jgi:hypothetical protein
MTMGARRQAMSRVLPGKAKAATPEGVQPVRHDAPRRVRNTVIDFSALALPEDVRLALAEAFWSHVGVRSERIIYTQWLSIKTFNRFACESGAITGLADLHRGTLVRYVEWLNAQCGPGGKPWTKSTRANVYSALRRLLQWLERCRPGVIASIEYPFNPFPWTHRDTPPPSALPAQELRAILRACEADIARLRVMRDAAAAQRAASDGTLGSLGGLLEHIDRRCGGIVPTARELERSGNHPLKKALRRLGGTKQVEPCLYPRAVSLLPYYLAILIHTAGNPDPIVELDRDCLQPLPLLDDRQALVWFKGRAHSVQRRTFSSTDTFEPPVLVREILEWNERLRPLAPPAHRNRLFIFKGARTVNAMSSYTIHHLVNPFCERHGLPRFSLASVRPGVLSSFYRVSGNLRRTRSVANHAQLATTVRYVETPQVKAQHRLRIAALQSAFIGHIEKRQATVAAEPAAAPGPSAALLPGELVSMFGFGCKDPLAGIAPGTHRGELCTNFMGCFTCPNAVITPDPSTVARLLQARDHLHAAATTLHPARWQAFYAPQLRILEEDILPRFAARELAAAQPLMAQLPPLPDLR